MDWTARIDKLVGHDSYIHKDHKDVQNFINYMYAPYQKGDVLLDSMEEVGSDIFFKYRKPLYDIASYTGVKTICECGIREGRSSDSFTRAVSKREGKVYSFDPVFLPDTFVKEPYSQYWEPREMTGEEGYEKFGGAIKDIDLLYIDVDPHYFNPSSDLLNLWHSKVTGGGYIVMDDSAGQFDSSVANIEYSGVWRPVRDYDIMRMLLTFLDENYDEIEYCFTVFNNFSNGFAILKLLG